jgi:carbamoyl-phosphate synthase large subunit
VPVPERILFLGDAFRIGLSLDEIHEETAIDPWFLAQIEQLIQTEQALAGRSVDSLSVDELRFLKRKGFSDRRLATLLGTHQHAVRERRWSLGVRPVYKRVDTCGGRVRHPDGLHVQHLRRGVRG